MMRRSCPFAPCMSRTWRMAEGASTGAGEKTTGGAVPRIQRDKSVPSMSSEVSGGNPLTKTASPTTNERTPRRSRWGSRAAIAAGIAGRGMSTTQEPSRSEASYTVAAERGPAEPSRGRNAPTIPAQSSADIPLGAWIAWHVTSTTSRPSMPGWRPGRST
eukprot:4708558-Alexandrium_andersonii.AAC.2